MTISYAMLLDGGFIRHKLGTAQRPADSDFVPAMKFARREGAQLILITLGHGTRIGLKEHADLVFDQYPLPA